MEYRIEVTTAEGTTQVASFRKAGLIPAIEGLAILDKYVRKGCSVLLSVDTLEFGWHPYLETARVGDHGLLRMDDGELIHR